MRGFVGDKRAVLLIILASYLMIVLDVSIVITGLPRIRQELGFSRTALSWVTTAYSLAFGGLLLLGARCGDLFGRRRMFLLGLCLFTAASMMVGTAPSAGWLIASRALQGAGAAILAPATLALLSTHFGEGTERNRAVGYHAAIAGIGASLGLVLGGLFADWISWRAGFFINLPIGIALFVAARRYLRESERHAGELDLASALSSTFGMGALVFGLVRAAENGWQDRIALASLAIGPLLLGLLVWNEARAAHPIMPLRLFGHGERARAYAARILFLGGMGGFWFFTTQLLQGVLGLRPALAGLAFLPTTIPNFFAALWVPRLTARHGNSLVLLTGISTAAVGMAWLSSVGSGGDYLREVAPAMLLIGVGQGLSLGPLTLAGMRGVEPRDAGAASGVINAAHQLGLSLGLAVLVVVFAGSTGTLANRISAALAGTMGFLALAGVLAAISAARVRPYGPGAARYGKFRQDGGLDPTSLDEP
jgi:EmrB/QacA subfamily drug resistance transporter